MISMEEQKKIAIEMWQYIKSLIENDMPFYSITWAKQKWLKHNHPDIQWKNSCLLCDVYTHLYIYMIMVPIRLYVQTVHYPKSIRDKLLMAVLVIKIPHGLE